MLECINFILHFYKNTKLPYHYPIQCRIILHQRISEVWIIEPMNQIEITRWSYNKRYPSRYKEHIWMRPISNNVKLYSDQRNVSRVMSPIWRSDLCLKCGLSRHWSMQNTFSKNNVCWNKAKRQKLLDNYIVNPWQTLNLLFCAKK